MLRVVKTDHAPEAIGPYSQAVIAGDWVFCSGQIGMNKSGELVEGIEAQTKQVLFNLQAVLLDAGVGWDGVVKTTVYLSLMENFQEMNQVYAHVLGECKPARATVEVKGLPKGALVEIECVARLSGSTSL